MACLPCRHVVILLPVGVVSAQTSAGPLVYVTSDHSANVSLIDMGTGTCLATIGVGGAPWGIVVTPDGGAVSAWQIAQMKGRNAVKEGP